MADKTANRYERYHIDIHTAPDIVPWPSRFQVKVGRLGLAKLLLTEIIHYRGDMEPVLSRPCLYGVFSGPVGGFLPRPEKCVGCLRCTTQYPEFVEVRPNPARQLLGDSFFTFDKFSMVAYEAQTGAVPVKGAGYRGEFGGQGWDGMWTDMSEIVRPTRDGIHGREFISTVVDIGSKPNYLVFDDSGWPQGAVPHSFSIPLPLLFDTPPHSAASSLMLDILAGAAGQIQGLAFLPLATVLEKGLMGPQVAPLLAPEEAGRLAELPFRPQLVALEGWDETVFKALRDRMPDALICLRQPFTSGQALLAQADAGVKVFHLTADYHGRGPDGAHVMDLIRAAHQTFVGAGRRDEVTLLGSGGMILAEHVPKAIISGLDAVVLDTPLLAALQAEFAGEVIDRESRVKLPPALTRDWGVQRLTNLCASWRDQLLEIMGAMGLREVRRLRGEMGRAMFQKDLEREAFAGIEGYDG